MTDTEPTVNKEQEILEAVVQMRTDGENILVPVEIGGRTVLAALTPAAVEAIKTTDPTKIRDVGTKTQYRVIQTTSNGDQQGPWQDNVLSVETREVSASTPVERSRQPGPQR